MQVIEIEKGRRCLVWKLAGEMMMMKMKFTDIVFGVKKMTNEIGRAHV